MAIVATADDILLEMAEELRAFVRPEAEARAADERWKAQLRVVQPHRITAALQRLLADGRLVADHDVTRGGRQITTFRPGDLSGRERPTADAAARKRLLYARYLSWASGSPSAAGLIGPAGQRMVHRTLRDVSPELGYKLEDSRIGDTSRFLDVEVPGGPLDNAAHLFLGEPSRRYSIPIEVKSRREWIYHTSTELYQVLYKAAALQLLLPKALIVPVLVCRRAHITAFRMLNDLGGYIIEVREQWLPADNTRVESNALLEVRNELAFLDLLMAPADGIHVYLRRHLTTHLPRELPEQADKWASAGSRFAAEYEALWRGGSRANLARIRQEMRVESRYGGGW
jgi:hypothetical protein